MSLLEIDLDEALLQEFHTEVVEIMDHLIDDFMTFEEQIDNLPQDLIDQVFRGLHTIKGNAGFVGLSNMSHLAHAMEDIFSAVRSGTLQIQINHIDSLFSGLDSLKKMLDDPINSNDIDISTLMAIYQAILNPSSQPKSTAAPANHPLLEQFLNSDDLIERIDLLQNIENKQLTECIPALWKYIETPFDDDPLNVILDSTIRELLKYKRDYIVEGLFHSSVNVQTLCAQLAGKYQLKSALQPLLAIIDQTTDTELLRASLKSVGELQEPDALKSLKQFALNDNPVLAATAVSALGLIQPEFTSLYESFTQLPELPALAMLDGMAKEKTDTTIAFIINHIHHPNSVIRRVIAAHIITINEPAITHLAQKLTKGNRDEKIMAANILAKINHQGVFPYLILATHEKDENIRFAAYEALGEISSCQTCYTCYDGIGDPSLSIRTLVLTYLEENICAVVTGKIRRDLQKDNEKAQRIREAMAHVATTKILDRITEYPELFEPIFEQIKQNSSVIILEQYKALLLQDNCKDLQQIWNNVQIKTIGSTTVHNQNILIVDDSATVLRITTNLLNKAGYTTFTAMNGRQGLKILSKQPIHIVITDMNMPEMNGIEMTREIKQNILLDKIPLIMHTTEQNENEKQAARHAGIDLFLTKPFKPQELLKNIETLLK